MLPTLQRALESIERRCDPPKSTHSCDMGDQLNAERLVTAYRIGRLEDVANELAMKRWLEEIGAEKLHFLLWNEFQARNQKR